MKSDCENLHVHIHAHPDAQISSRLAGIEKDIDVVMDGLSTLLDRQAYFHRSEMRQIGRETHELGQALEELANSLGPDKQAEIDKIRALTARLNALGQAPEDPPVNTAG